MKRLVFKHTAGKAPFVGIRFEDRSKAETLNSDLIYKYKNLEYYITIEPVGKNITLRLCCDEPLIMRKYSDLEYDSISFQNFVREKTKSHAYFNFGHVIRAYQYDVPAKVKRTFEMFVLKVKDVKIVYDQY